METGPVLRISSHRGHLPGHHVPGAGGRWEAIRVRLATWNVNSVKARLPRLLEWLDEAKPDIVGLQEIKTTTALFPEDEVAELGYEVAAHGEGRWNGVALLSSVGLDDVSLGFPGEPGYGGEPGELTLIDEPGLRRPEARAVGATCGGIRVWSLYAPNGRTPDSAHYAYKLDWFAALRTALAAEIADHPQLAACGDFNVAPTDDDVWDPAVFVGSTHVTPPERQALADLRALGLRDVVPTPMKGPHPFTYWDYRAGAFAKNNGMRIDLVYATGAVAGRVTAAYVDREARKGKGPSDHAPVVVDLS
jgi:exodeoxyribonuclease III